MFLQLSLKLKTTLLVATIAILAILSVSLHNIPASQQTMEQAAKSQLAQITSARSEHLAAYFTAIKEDLQLVATSPATRDALARFSTEWYAIEGNKENTLKDLYIEQNPYPLGEKDKLYDAEDGSGYSAAHAEHHPWYHNIQQTRGYYDIFLINSFGDLVYSVFKEQDYATNLIRGRWAGTGLGTIAKNVLRPQAGSAQVFDDFKPYAPSADAPASFIGQAVTNSDGVILGAVVFQMPIDNINKIVANPDGLGETGQSYIVGPDYLMRSNARFMSQQEQTTGTILARRIETSAVRQALDGNEGDLLIENSNDQTLLTAYAPFEFMNTRWAFISEISKTEVDQPIRSQLNVSILIAAVATLIAALFGAILTRYTLRPLDRITEAAKNLASGDLALRIPYLGDKTETGRMADALAQFQESVLETERLKAKAAEEEKAREEQERIALEQKAEMEKQEALQREEQRLQRAAERQAALNQLANDLESQIGDLVNETVKRTGTLHSSAEQVKEHASEIVDTSNISRRSANEAGMSAQTVASGSEEMAISIAEIRDRIEDSLEITVRARTEADGAAKQVQELSTKAQNIGDIINLINDIADQTNLLALNATIEAARAGESGRGFAVVASEVKSLAAQTAQATEQIASQINEVQSVSESAKQSVDAINKVITEVDSTSQDIASSVTQQTAAVAEISRAATTAAQHVDILESNVLETENKAISNNKQMDEMGDIVGVISQDAQSLKASVADFLQKVRGNDDQSETSANKEFQPAAE